MSDGNFNRSLLPHTPYQSGLKMGKAMARRCAVAAFCEYMQETHPDFSPEETAQHSERFGILLSKHSL